MQWIAIPEKKKPRLLSAANGKGRTSEVYGANIHSHSQSARMNPDFFQKMEAVLTESGLKWTPIEIREINPQFLHLTNYSAF